MQKRESLNLRVLPILVLAALSSTPLFGNESAGRQPWDLLSTKGNSAKQSISIKNFRFEYLRRSGADLVATSEYTQRAVFNVMEIARPSNESGYILHLRDEPAFCVGYLDGGTQRVGLTDQEDDCIDFSYSYSPDGKAVFKTQNDTYLKFDAGAHHPALSVTHPGGGYALWETFFVFFEEHHSPDLAAKKIRHYIKTSDSNFVEWSPSAATLQVNQIYPTKKQGQFALTPAKNGRGHYIALARRQYLKTGAETKAAGLDHARSAIMEETKRPEAFVVERDHFGLFSIRNAGGLFMTENAGELVFAAPTAEGRPGAMQKFQTLGYVESEFRRLEEDLVKIRTYAGRTFLQAPKKELELFFGKTDKTRPHYKIFRHSKLFAGHIKCLTATGGPESFDVVFTTKIDRCVEFAAERATDGLFLFRALGLGEDSYYLSLQDILGEGDGADGYLYPILKKTEHPAGWEAFEIVREKNPLSKPLADHISKIEKDAAKSKDLAASRAEQKKKDLAAKADSVKKVGKVNAGAGRGGMLLRKPLTPKSAQRAQAQADFERKAQGLAKAKARNLSLERRQAASVKKQMEEKTTRIMVLQRQEKQKALKAEVKNIREHIGDGVAVREEIKHELVEAVHQQKQIDEMAHALAAAQHETKIEQRNQQIRTGKLRLKAELAEAKAQHDAEVLRRKNKVRQLKGLAPLPAL